MGKRWASTGNEERGPPSDAPPLPAVTRDGSVDIASMLAVADIVPVMIAYIDRDLRYRFVNKPLADWFERPRAEILGLSLREMLGEEAYAERKSLLALALAGERQFFASSFVHPTRGVVAVQTDYVPFADADGRVHGILILVQDVTEQRAADRSLRESESRFRRIADLAPAIMWVTRLDRVRDFVNQAYADFVGVGDRDEARLVDWKSRIHPDDVERIVAESLAGEASMETFTLEGRYLRGDGEWRWLRSVSSPRFGPDGEHVGFIGVATDVTPAKEAELELKRQVEERTAKLAQSEMQFRAIFDTLLEVLVLMDPDGTIIRMNRKEASWRDLEPDLAVGRKIWDSPTLKAYPQHIPLIRKAVATAAMGETFSDEVKMEREGAPTSFLDVAVQPIRDAAGKVVFLLFEARDITDLKAIQEQLRQSQKMEALGQLTGGFAHDFNNLLTVVVGGLDLITKRIDDPKLRTYAGNALAAAERGARLTGQLLAFSRVQRLEVRSTEIAPLIENMRPLLRNVLGPGVQKAFKLEAVGVPVMADPTQVEVAVLNLAINARDAMPDGGILTFATRPVEIADDPELADGRYVELAISDTGVGMSEEVASRAFEPFFTTKDVGKGTGLGLSMVYGMARQSGGTARIESAPGTGTTVKILLRAAEAAGEESEASEANSDDAVSAVNAASILVIDDDPDVRAFIAETLEDAGYRVRQAADGPQGLAQAVAERPDLAVIDFIMPGMSGAEVARHLLDRWPKQPILFVSGYSETDAIRGVAPQAQLLAKPFRSDALGQAVRKALAPG
jgi:PAS domain S-box-containing protein